MKISTETTVIIAIALALIMMGAGYGVFAGSTSIMEEWFGNKSSKLDSDNIPTSSKPEPDQNSMKINREVEKVPWQIKT